MSTAENQKATAAVVNIWSRFRKSLKKEDNEAANEQDDKNSVLSAVERQTENSRKGGTIWEAVRKADEEAFKRLVTLDPQNVNARGPVGECPAHMLFLYGTETHLKMARYLIKNFPYTITQIYNQAVRRFILSHLVIRAVLFFRNTMAKLFFILRLLNEIRLWLSGY